MEGYPGCWKGFFAYQANNITEMWELVIGPRVLPLIHSVAFLCSMMQTSHVSEFVVISSSKTNVINVVFNWPSYWPFLSLMHLWDELDREVW